MAVDINKELTFIRQIPEIGIISVMPLTGW